MAVSWFVSPHHKFGLATYVLILYRIFVVEETGASGLKCNTDKDKVKMKHHTAGLYTEITQLSYDF